MNWHLRQWDRGVALDWNTRNRSLRLSRVMQLSAQSFHDQTNDRIGYGICCQRCIETDSVMHPKYCNGAGHGDEGPKIPHALAGWKCCNGKERPKNSHQQSDGCPDRDSVFHSCHPDKRGCALVFWMQEVQPRLQSHSKCPVNQVIGWFPDHCLPDNDLGNLCVIMAVGRQSCLHRESAASSKDAYMMTISLLGVAAALLLCAILAKAFAHEPKASKSQKAEIVARLLALSETEQKLSKPASSVRLKAPIPIKPAGRQFAPATKSESGERAKTPVPTLDVRFPKQQSPQRRTNLAGSSS